MIKTPDNTIEIEIASSSGDVVFQPSDWSIINLPIEQNEARHQFANLYNMPVSRHISLVLCRHRRKTRLAALSNAHIIEETGWSYLETVNITYEKPSSCSNNGFLPLSEVGLVVYKGDVPDTKNTSWFSGFERANSTNLWDLATQESEPQSLYYQKFSWETNLLMKSMAGNLETRRFIYAFPVDNEEVLSIRNFCKKFELTCRLYVQDTKQANDILAALRSDKK